MIDDMVEAVARCLAKGDGPFISAHEWRGARGATYRKRARALLDPSAAGLRSREVLRTIANVNAGIRSGGLPPR